MLELVVGRDSPGAPSTTLWFSVPAVAVLVLPLFARRRFPFAAPAAYWLLAAALTFVDGLLIPFIGSLGVVGLATAFLLGNLRTACKAGIGLAHRARRHRRSSSPTSPARRRPASSSSSPSGSWSPGSRATPCASAPSRPKRPRYARRQAEREREAAARVAVAEERARIARELHDIVAHAVSVMVLQVGAVRHKLPEMLAEDRDALEGVERAGRTALAEMRRLLGAMRRDGDGLELAPQPGVDGLDSLLDEVGRAGLPVELHVDGEPFPLPRGDRSLRLSNRAGRPDQRAQARARQPRRRDRPLRGPTSCRSRCATTARAARRATASVTALSASVNASRSTVAR